MEKKETFSSRWGLILASLGMAIGCGNIWRFPRIAASNGGAAFLIPWIIFLVLWSIPLLIIEYSLGRGTRMGVIGSFGKIMGPKYSFMGGFIAFCSMAIMFYYSVVTGWCIKYFLRGVMGTPLLKARDYWGSFTSSYQPILFHLLAVLLGSFIIYRGIEAGIEKASKFLLPSLFLLLVIAAVRAITLPGAVKGLNFLFNPEWHYLRDYRVWLQGLTQSAWSTGAGWGLILTYAVYMKKREDTVLNSFIVGFGNDAASLLAGLAIIPTIFALLPPAEAESVIKGSDNIGLTFISIPTLFSKMPAGSFFMSLFFLSLTFAALSSLISMLELTCRIFMDAGLTRKKAVFFVGVMTFLLGLPSAFSLAFFENQDWVWGLGLMVSGFFFAIAITRYGVSRFREEWVNAEGCDLKVGRWFDILVKYFIPVEFVLMLSWWFYQAVRWDPKGWWDITKPTSLGTCLFQWLLVIFLFIIANRWVVKKTFRGEATK